MSETNAERLEDHARDINGNIGEIMEVLQNNEELSERVQELERKNKTLSNNHFQQLEQYQGLVERNKRLREIDDAQAELYRRLNADYVKKCDENERYRETIEKAIEEEEQNLEGYQSAVHKILTEVLEDSK